MTRYPDHRDFLPDCHGDDAPADPLDALTEELEALGWHLDYHDTNCWEEHDSSWFYRDDGETRELVVKPSCLGWQYEYDDGTPTSIEELRRGMEAA